MFYSHEDGFVIKTSKGKPIEKGFPVDLDNIPLFNYYFPNTAYDILGYGELEGAFVRILRQPMVDFAGNASVSVDERVEHMASLGFRPLNKENTAFTNDDFVVADLQKANIVRDADGNVRVIDADMKLHTTDVGGNYSYPDVEEDTDVRFHAKRGEKETAPETESVQKEHQPSVVSSADGAKVLKDLDTLIKEYDENANKRPNTFLGDVANALGARKHGSNSQYATFETVNGNIVAIRLADHNAKVSTFDNHEEQEGISIVVTAKENKGLINDGDAHVVEFFYDAIKLRRSENKPLVEILKSIKQSLYSGEYKDNTGLAQVEEVNGDDVRFKVYGGNSGYVGYSKSKRAVAAEERGLKNASQMNSEFAKEVNTIIEERTGNPSKLTLKAIKAALPDIKADEWHHTSKFGNKTNYYSAERVASHFAKDPAEEAAERLEREAAKRRDAYALAVRAKIPKMKVETALGEQEAFITSEGYAVEIPNYIRSVPNSARLFATGELIGVEPYVVDSLSEWAFSNHEAYDNAVQEYIASVEKAKAEVEAEMQESISEDDASEPARFRVSDSSKRKSIFDVAEEINHRLERERAERSELEAVNARFNAELEDFKKKTHVGLLHLGSPGAILRASGVNANSITLSPSVLHQHLKKHKLSADDIKDLPKALQAPILVYKHGLKHPNIVVVTEMEVRDGKISVSLQLDNDGNVVEVDNVRSVHSKNATKELERLSLLPLDALKNNLRWVDKEKVSDWLGLPYMGERQDVNPKLFSTANIVSNFENPQVSDVKKDETDTLFRLSDEAREARKKARMAEEAAQSVHEAAAEQYEEAVKSVAGKNLLTWIWNAVKDPKAFRNDLAEAYLDATRSVKQLQDAIEKSYGEKLKAFENVWWALNRKSSVDAIEMERTQRDFIAPLTEALGKLIKTSKRGIKNYKDAVADVEVYLNAVHGLERNLHMAKRNARNKMIKGYKSDGMKLSDAVAKADAEIAAMEAKGEEWWKDERRDYSGFTELFGEKGEKLSIEELEERARDFIEEFESETGVAERDAAVLPGFLAMLAKNYGSTADYKGEYIVFFNPVRIAS